MRTAGVMGITQLVGNTPLLRVRVFEREFPNIEVYAKAEWFNPGGSVKDRAALSMIEDGERRGALTRNRTVIDSTSGNTGIAYALIGGATGTFVGTSRRLKEHDASIQTIAVEPDDSFHGLEGLKHLPTAIVPRVWDPSLADEVWGCPTEPAYDLARQVARTEGLLVGHSSGAALWAVRRLAGTIREGVVVTVFPDSGDRYLSTGLYGRKI